MNELSPPLVCGFQTFFARTSIGIKTFVISLSRNRSKFFELAWDAKLIGETRPIEVLAKNV
jgi:hypothetical protein